MTILALAISSALFVPPAGAAAMTTSEAAVAMMKDYEGFRSHVYWDSGYAYIGYGTICRSWDYPDGITQEKADELMREALKLKEDAINKFLTKYSIILTQNQFDAVLSLTYNVGTSWMNSGTRLFSYLVNGVTNYTDIQIVNAIGTWCHQGKSVNKMLVQRRLHEAKIFLYGDYADTDPHQYRYLTFNAGKGEVENSIVFFVCGLPYGEFQTAILSGKYFAGWATDGGVYITASTLVEKDLAVTAVWSNSPVTAPVQSSVFPDVKETDWYYMYVKDLSAAKIISGLPDGSFGPNNVVTYGEALKLIMRAAGFDPQPPVDSNWASGYLKLAVAKGLVATGEITDLNTPATRLEIARITAKALGLPPLDPETSFSDTTDGYVLALYRCDIVTGNSETGVLLYKPQETMTRSEISAIIWRIGKSDAVPH
jgi:GH24 family phage-related lysozyme (muramidase)